MSADRMPISRGIAPLADIPDRQRRDRPPELVVRREHSVIAMPVLPRRRHEIGQPVQKLKRRELDDAIGPRPGGLAAAAPPDPVGGFVPGQHVADASDAAICTTDRGEPFERERWPGAVSQQVLIRSGNVAEVPLAGLSFGWKSWVVWLIESGGYNQPNDRP